MSITTLIRLLADGKFHSGEELGNSLGVTRAAVWKQLKQLQSLNISVEAVKGGGYRLLEPLILLDKKSIKESLDLPESAPRLASLEIFDRIDSTNTYLLGSASAVSGSVVVAEQQLAGRGRRGRLWQSPFGRNLYVSVFWCFDSGVAALEGLSLAVGIMLVSALEEFGISGVGLKWPNDLLYQGRKVAGILVEMTGDTSGPCSAVIGFGINVNMPRDLGSDIDQPWSDLSSIFGKPIDRNKLLAVILRRVLFGLAEFSKSGFSVFHSQWQKHDAFFNRDVVIYQGENVILGKALGITDNGSLKVVTDAGECIVNGGEVSLRVSQ